MNSTIVNNVNNENTAKEKVQGQFNDSSLQFTGYARVAYILQILSFLFGITGIIGVILSYLKIDQSRGTWLESHFRRQIRTFWFSLLWIFLGGIFTILPFVGFLIEFFVIIIVLIWVLYRAISGLVLLNKQMPI